MHVYTLFVYRIILEGFCGGDPSKKDNATGIQLLGVILTNGFSPFNSNHNVDKKRLEFFHY